MNLYAETIKIFRDRVTATTREKDLRRLFRTSGETLGTPLHSLVAGILKAKLPESETETKLRTLIGTAVEDITPTPKPTSEVEATVNMVIAKLGLAPREEDQEAAERARLARIYPTMIESGSETPTHDLLEGLNVGQREIVESFYGSGGKMDFGFQDSAAPEPADPEAEAEALRLYPSMKRS